MRVLIVSAGRFGKAPERRLFDHYRSRITWPFDLIEIEEKKPLKGAELKRREAELLLAKIPDGAKVVALDEKGKTLPSLEIAAKLGAWRDDGLRDVAFVIGGADGLDSAVTERADLTLSLGRMTWPHMLVRVMMAEQVFRAQCILSGHPYHRE